MKLLKKIGLVLITFGLFYSVVSCNKEKSINDQEVHGYGFYPNTGIQIRIEDKNGNDVLSGKTGTSLTIEDIDRIIYVGKKNREEVYYNALLRTPKGFEISKDEKSHYLSFDMFMTNYNDKFYNNYLRIGKKGRVHKIKVETERLTSTLKDSYGGAVVSLKKVWLDGVLVWEATSENPIERKANIKIVL